MQMAVAQVRVDERTKNRKHRYQVNRAQALSRMKDTMIQILNGKDPALWIRRLIGSMAENINPIRPGRKFERKHHQRAGVRVNPTYKRGW